MCHVLCFDFFKSLNYLKSTKELIIILVYNPLETVTITELHIQVSQQVVLQSQTHQNSPSSCTVTPMRSLSLLLTLCHSSELQKH